MRPESQQVQEFLRDRGAGQLPHPGGTLYEHLVRVAALLAQWGADQDLQMAGLCHACYGTVGYPHALLGLDERPVLTALAGARAESLVYLYGSCDRAAVYPALEEPRPAFRDRFTSRTHIPPERDIRAFAELTAANELDVIRHNAALADRHGAALRQFFAGIRARLSDAAWHAWSQQPGPDPAGQPGPEQPMPPVTITRLDHLVLTVADLDQSTGFYQRVLGMRPVTFGTGRRALEFGASKINLHQAGEEITPHAARPAPGSADLCLITTAPPGQVLAHLGAQGVPVEDGPVPRTGARGPITSIYIRDPDGNLIEIASYPAGPPAAQASEPWPASTTAMPRPQPSRSRGSCRRTRSANGGPRSPATGRPGPACGCSTWAPAPAPGPAPWPTGTASASWLGGGEAGRRGGWVAAALSGVAHLRRNHSPLIAMIFTLMSSRPSVADRTRYQRTV